MFLTGTKVFYPRLNKYGTVVRCINAEDAEDRRLQGYRYFIDVAGIRYSVPHSSLKPATVEAKRL